MLRSIVGEPAFRKALTQLQVERRFQKIGTDDLQRALESASGLELDAYFRAWVYGTTLPRVEWSSRDSESESGYRTDIRVRAEGLPGPVPLELVVLHAAAQETRRVWLDPAGGRFTIETAGKPREVRVNHDLGLLAEVNEQ
jgi:aminopeptidase N